MKAKIIIGDIHGRADQLKILLDEVRRDGRPVIFLGDYVNRGPQSKEVLDGLIQFAARRGNATFLCGNHDWALLRYIDSKCFDQLALLGGLQTLASYLPGEVCEDPHVALSKAMPEAHLHFLRRLLAYYEDEFLMCSHTGVPVEPAPGIGRSPRWS